MSATGTVSAPEDSTGSSTGASAVASAGGGPGPESDVPSTARDELDVPITSSRGDDHPSSSYSSSSSSPFLTTTLSQGANAGDQRVQVVSHEGCHSGMVVRITAGDGELIS